MIPEGFVRLLLRVDDKYNFSRELSEAGVGEEEDKDTESSI